MGSNGQIAGEVYKEADRIYSREETVATLGHQNRDGRRGHVRAECHDEENLEDYYRVGIFSAVDLRYDYGSSREHDQDEDARRKRCPPESGQDHCSLRRDGLHEVDLRGSDAQHCAYRRDRPRDDRQVAQ